MHLESHQFDSNMVGNTTRICADISIQIITMQSGLIKGCPEIACLKITATTKDQS